MALAEAAVVAAATVVMMDQIRLLHTLQERQNPNRLTPAQQLALLGQVEFPAGWAARLQEQQLGGPQEHGTRIVKIATERIKSHHELVHQAGFSEETTAKHTTHHRLMEDHRLAHQRLVAVDTSLLGLAVLLEGRCDIHGQS